MATPGPSCSHRTTQSATSAIDGMRSRSRPPWRTKSPPGLDRHQLTLQRPDDEPLDKYFPICRHVGPGSSVQLLLRLGLAAPLLADSGAPASPCLDDLDRSCAVSSSTPLPSIKFESISGLIPLPAATPPIGHALRTPKHDRDASLSFPRGSAYGTGRGNSTESRHWPPAPYSPAGPLRDTADFRGFCASDNVGTAAGGATRGSPRTGSARGAAIHPGLARRGDQLPATPGEVTSEGMRSSLLRGTHDPLASGPRSRNTSERPR